KKTFDKYGKSNYDDMRYWTNFNFNRKQNIKTTGNSRSYVKHHRVFNNFEYGIYVHDSGQIPSLGFK
ncbi:hypothetical protein WFZ85_15695, partial [Flavobacterium sp. j3]